MTPEFPVSIADLDAGGREFKFAVRAAWVRGALEDTGATAAGPDGELDVRVSKSGKDVVVRGQLNIALVTPCARCLNDVTIRLEHPLTALMVPASEMHGGKDGEEQDLTAEELDVLPYSGETIALDDLVRDELVLEIPIVPLCSEECPGISPPPAREGEGKATAEAAIDPRLLPLLRLKSTVKTEKKE
ncbi:MAG: YceD family protein [Polyangiaceae bacterium]|jgi:uncharacterized protein